MTEEQIQQQEEVLTQEELSTEQVEKQIEVKTENLISVASADPSEIEQVAKRIQAEIDKKSSIQKLNALINTHATPEEKALIEDADLSPKQIESLLIKRIGRQPITSEQKEINHPMTNNNIQPKVAQKQEKAERDNIGYNYKELLESAKSKSKRSI